MPSLPNGHPVDLATLAELADLRHMVGDPGPFLSAYVALGAGDPASDGTGARWRARRLSLAAAGAPAHVLAAVDGALSAVRPAARGACVVASPHGEPHVEYLDTAPLESATWAPLPRLRPLIAARQRTQPHVVALVDRSGADVLAEPERHLGRPVVETVPGSGEAGREGRWPHAIVEVAREVAGLTAVTDARLVALGGEHEAVSLLIDELPPPVRAVLWPIDAERPDRPPGGDRALADAEVRAAVGEWVEGRLAGGLHVLDARLAAGAGATAGAGDTLDALRAGRVEVLMVAEEGEPRRRAWMGREPRDLATSPLRLVDVHGARSVPVLDAAVWAALGLGVDVRVVPSPVASAVSEGIAALLR